MKNKITKSTLIGFGASAALDAHVFKVSVPSSRTGEVVLTENYGFLGDQSGLLDSEKRAVLPRSKWTPIAEASREDFNTRLRNRNEAVGTWKTSVNLLDRMLGKELCVLMWACEPAADNQIEIICANWSVLRPEDRWWLYSMTAAKAAGSEDGQSGWRIALYNALSDGTKPTLRNAALLKTPKTTSLFD